MRNITIKIIISLALIGVGIGIYYIFRPKQTTNSGNITINLYEVNEILVDTRAVPFEEGSSLLQLLEENYEIRYDKGMYGAVIYDINSLKTDFKNNYIAIYVDGKYSEYGIDYIKLVNGMIIDFKVEEIWS